MRTAGGYRRDIDGMRALAIIPAILSHLHVPGFAGGFVGVDVFFVISGYLITAIITREFDRGTFSFARFYERRARRILPALLVMIAFVLVGATWLYLPGDFEAVPQSALMTLAFLANVWFYTHAGYFTASADTMPLLNCWSLAVEEQFYFAMPFLLWLIARFVPGKRTVVFVAAGLLSLAWACWHQDHYGAANYYLPVSRAWELMAGALLTVRALPELRRRFLREALAFLGIGLFVFAVWFCSPDTPYPGIATVPPVLGAVLLLYAAPGTLVGRLLSMRLPVFIGLISYSLYLWHWPLIAFAEYRIDAPVSGILRVEVLFAALLAAWASWYFVERPFRDHTIMSRQRIFMLSGGGIAFVGLAAAAILPLKGWESRFSPDVLRVVTAEKGYSPLFLRCVDASQVQAREGCAFGAAAEPTSLVWSDSFGFDLARALGEELKPQGEGLILHSLSACPPLLDFGSIDYPECKIFNDFVFAHLTHTTSIKRVYLMAAWPTYLRKDTITKIDETISRIRAAGKTVVIVGSVPVQEFDVPRRLAHLAARGLLDNARGTSAIDYQNQNAWFTANYPRWQTEGITILDPARALVAGEHTRIILGGLPLYIDDNHLSLAGAKAVLAADLRR